MIEIAGTQYALNDPVLLVGGGVVALILLLLFLSLRAANRSARMAEPLARQMAHLGQHVQQLGGGRNSCAAVFSMSRTLRPTRRCR